MAATGASGGDEFEIKPLGSVGRLALETIEDIIIYRNATACLKFSFQPSCYSPPSDVLLVRVGASERTINFVKLLRMAKEFPRGSRF
jgi:hypothetical protein